MKPFKKTFKKDGKSIEVLFRQPKLGDAKAAMEFINSSIKEKVFIFATKTLKIREEKVFIKGAIKKIKEKKLVQVFALHNKKIIGVCGIETKGMVQAHVGTIGIIIAKEYRNIGLGKFLISFVMKKSKKVMGIKIAKLDVHHANKIAYNLYKKIGFKDVGKIPNAFIHYGKYYDEIIMYKKL